MPERYTIEQLKRAVENKITAMKLGEVWIFAEPNELDVDF